MTNQTTNDSVPSTDEDWQAELTTEEYKILRQGETEPPGSSDLLKVCDDGVFRCVGCGQVLFTSNEKFKSKTGWPSFYDPVDGDAVETRSDDSPGLPQTEVICSKCEGHLGHVVDDGPKPTGKRYCINGKTLDFETDES